MVIGKWDLGLIYDDGMAFTIHMNLCGVLEKTGCIDAFYLMIFISSIQDI